MAHGLKGKPPNNPNGRPRVLTDAERARSKLNNDIKTRYGITLDEFEERLAAQGGVCAICGKVCNLSRLSVDHDHETGRVRGLLCRRCNFMLGYAKDRPETLEAGARYLRR